MVLIVGQLGGPVIQTMINNLKIIWSLRHTNDVFLTMKLHSYIFLDIIDNPKDYTRVSLSLRTDIKMLCYRYMYE